MATRVVYSLVVGGCYSRVYIDGGRSYMDMVDAENLPSPAHVAVTIGVGSQGERLVQLRNWLYGRQVGVHECMVARPSPRKVTIRGVSLSMTPAQVMDIARRGLSEDPEGASRYLAWYVPVDGRRVGAKWLVQKISGLETGTFVSSEARRVLTALGVEVRRM
jgi:hypothetical protein